MDVESPKMTAEEEFDMFDVGDDTEWSELYPSSDSTPLSSTSPPTSPPCGSEEELRAEAAKWKRLYESLCEKVDTITNERDEALKENQNLKLQIATFKDIERYESSPSDKQTAHYTFEQNTDDKPLNEESAAGNVTRKAEKGENPQRQFKRPWSRSYARPQKEDSGLVPPSGTTNTSGQKRKHEDDEDDDEPQSKRPTHLGQNGFSSFGNMWSKPTIFSPFVGPKASGPGRATDILPSDVPRNAFGGGPPCFAKTGAFEVTSSLSMTGAVPGWASATSSFPAPSSRFVSTEGTTAFYRDTDAANMSAAAESQLPREGGGRVVRSMESAPEEPAAEQDSTEAVTSKPATSRSVFGKPSPFQENPKPSDGIIDGGFSAYTQGSGFASNVTANSPFGTGAAFAPANGSSAISSKPDRSNVRPSSEVHTHTMPVNGSAYVAACRAWLKDAKNRIEDETIIDLFPPHPVHDCKRLGLQKHGHDCDKKKAKLGSKFNDISHQLQQVFDTLASFESPRDRAKWLKQEWEVWDSNKFSGHAGSAELREQLVERVDDIFSAIGSVLAACRSS